jgi:hypothetical protein
VDFIFGTRFGGLDIRPRDRIITVVPPPDWMLPLLDDGWMLIPHRHSETYWFRSDGGQIHDDRARSGRYDDRPPTNRKAKRARCKARRRARLPRRHWVARRRDS